MEINGSAEGEGSMNTTSNEAAEIIAAVPSCPDCGSRAVVACVAPPGQRERPVYLSCQACGSERPDLEFYET